MFRFQSYDMMSRPADLGDVYGDSAPVVLLSEVFWSGVQTYLGDTLGSGGGVVEAAL